jgi:formylglycine-generating enzyme required for sulfatase activity
MRAATMLLTAAALHAAAAAAQMQRIGRFEIDRTEVTIGEFRRFVQDTGLVTTAERAGGGSTYEGGWQRRPGWNWHSPFGSPGAEREPAVHVTYREADAFCRWAGKRLPTDEEWGEAAYVERRERPPEGFVRNRRHPYPTGDSPTGANCLGDCGEVPTVRHAVTTRGRGHAEAGTTRGGVNGLFEMGGNAWEWVDSGPGPQKRTRGGSWWYGAAQMRDEHVESKPFDTAVVYIGFRCARG